jgi:hypothetical protein
MRVRLALLLALVVDAAFPGLSAADESDPIVHRRPFIQGAGKLRADRQCLEPNEPSRVQRPEDVRGAPSGYSYDLVIALLTTQENEVRRHALRHSWAKKRGESCSVLFVLIFADGSLDEPLVKRTSSHMLELTVPTAEAYLNLPSKVLMAFSWIAEHLSFKYLLKTDDDSYACVGGLLHQLEHLPRNGLYWGKLRPAGQPIEMDGRWQDRGFARAFNTEQYGVYAFGAGYMLSADLVAKASRRMRDVAGVCHVEDGLVGATIVGTGWLKRARRPERKATDNPARRHTYDGHPPAAVLSNCAGNHSAQIAARRAAPGEGGTRALLKGPNVVHLVNTSRVKDFPDVTHFPAWGTTQGFFTITPEKVGKICHLTVNRRSPFVAHPATSGGQAHWRKVKGEATERGHYLVLHRISAAMIRNCSKYAGEYCGVY